VGGAVAYVIGFGSFRGPREWPAELVARLRLVGEIFAGALTRKRDDERLRESEANLRRLLETTHVVPWEADARTWRFPCVGPQAPRLFGFPAERWLDPGFWVDQIHPEDRDYAVEYCLRASAIGEPYEFDYRMIAADGRTVWLHDVVSVEMEDG